MKTNSILDERWEEPLLSRISWHLSSGLLLIVGTLFWGFIIYNVVYFLSVLALIVLTHLLETI